MSLGKKDISINISTKAHISLITSSQLLNSFLEIIKKESNNSHIKISNFGTFYYKKSPSRIGRNPRTKENFPIIERLKLTFISSNKVRNIFN
tara:strand:+ start:10540 stop:10815 length:276 start_codon:yes stop_codon:yes gene_type:complete